MDLAAGEVILEYLGEIITWEQAQARHPHNPADPQHTFFFHVDASRVIDAAVGGNAARWINHSCDGNCEAEEQGGRIFIKALRDIAAGDYGLIIEQRYTARLKAQYPCWCGAGNCRGTLLAPKPKPKPKRRAVPDPSQARS